MIIYQLWRTTFRLFDFLLFCRHKVRHERIQQQRDHSTDKNMTILTGLYFDGKKDVSLVNEIEGNKFFRRKVTEEHISQLKEPGGKYIWHFTPVTGSSRSILGGTVKFTVDNGDSMHSLCAIVYDCTESILALI